MAGSSSKQGEKNESSKKTTSKNTSKNSTVSKKSKKPASFSRDAKNRSKVTKNVLKKSTKKVEKDIPKEVLEEIKKDPDFAEFETLKLNEAEKPEPKIVLRDVAKETPVEPLTDIPVEAPVKPPKEEKNVIIPKTPAVKPTPKTTAREIKEREIKKAINTATKLPVVNTKKRQRRGAFGEFGWKRALLATACVVTTVFAIIYFVNVTSADMSLRVAAAQSGIDAAYPSYTPRGYTLSDVTSSSGKVSMHFSSDEGTFGITEEISSWDSEAVLNNYIKPTYKDNYSVIREQGLTLFMGNNWEVWVNGGVLYKLTVDEGELTKKQMKSIATSF